MYITMHHQNAIESLLHKIKPPAPPQPQAVSCYSQTASIMLFWLIVLAAQYWLARIHIVKLNNRLEILESIRAGIVVSDDTQSNSDNNDSDDDGDDGVMVR